MGFSKYVSTDNSVIPNAVGVRRGDLVIDRTDQRFYRFKVNAVLDMRNQKNWEVSYLPDGPGVFLLTDRSDADYWLLSFSESLEPLSVPKSVADLATSESILSGVFL